MLLLLVRQPLQNMSSNGTLAKAQDYKQMVANGSIDSMDKSVLSSEAGSFEGYEQKPNYNEYVNQNALRPAQQGQQGHKVATISKASGHRARAAAAAAALEPDAFELSYRNEGFRDNSTYGGGTRANSISTSVAEDTPIIHHTDQEVDEGAQTTTGMPALCPSARILAEVVPRAVEGVVSQDWPSSASLSRTCRSTRGAPTAASCRRGAAANPCPSIKSWTSSTTLRSRRSTVRLNGAQSAAAGLSGGYAAAGLVLHCRKEQQGSFLPLPDS